ncbi:MAG TPA: sensor histidine kinase [Chloroflexota bacterium]
MNAIREARRGRAFRLWLLFPDHGDVWDRWFPFWHVVAYAALLFCLAVALLDRHTADKRWVIGIGVALWAVWYWAGVIHPGERRYRPHQVLLYFCGALPLFALLTALDGIFYLLTSFLYLLVFSLPPLRWALTGAGALTLLLIAWTVHLEARSPSALAPIAISFGVPAAMGLMLTLFIVSIIRQSAERRALIEELQTTRVELARREREAGMLEERGRLAREIHDTVAQGLVSVVMRLEAAEPLVPAAMQPVRTSLEEASRVARETLVEARRAVEGMRPAALEQTSLPEALRRTGEAWEVNSGVALQVEVTGAVRPLGPDGEVAALRVAQESLANVARHAGAARTVITLSYLEDCAILDVRDDGRGMKPDGAPRPPGTGYGLHTMQERVEALGGSLQIESAPGAGTTITAIIPLPEMPE